MEGLRARLKPFESEIRVILNVEKEFKYKLKSGKHEQLKAFFCKEKC